MNKFFLSVVFVCLFQGASLPADFAVEARVGAFFPSCKHFRDLYGDVLPHTQIEISKRECRCFDFWTSFNYAGSSAKVYDCRTRVNLYTWDMGISYPFFKCSCLSSYIGLGPTIGWTKVRNHLCTFSECATRTTVGGVAKWGLLYELPCCFFVDLYAQYIYQPINFKRCHNMGGVRVGLGLKKVF